MNGYRIGLVVGLSALTLIGNALAAVRYVDPNNVAPSFPHTSWATAATNIQQAVDSAAPGDTILVTNGVYATDSRSNNGLNRVNIAKAVKVQSVNGPANTIIRGYQVPGTTNGTTAVRCVYLNGGAILSGFTLENGATSSSESGGGVKCQNATAVITNCVILRNAAGTGAGVFSGTLFNCTVISNSVVGFGSGGGMASSAVNNSIIAGNRAGYRGGGVWGGTATNCVLINNYASSYGGGSDGAKLVNCTVVNNTAYYSGGGAEGGTLLNSIAYYNQTLLFNSAGTNISGLAMTNSCADVLPFFGANNITNPPLFSDLVNQNLRLQPLSPCRNAGHNAYITNSLDLDGNPRIAGSSVDMGAYENGFGGTVRYVAANNPSATAPFTNWVTAASNIQQAIDASLAGDFIYVTNGIYDTGGRAVYGLVTNRVVVDKAIAIQSVNGPESTIIVGERNASFPPSGMRCLYLTNGVQFSGFTLTNGTARNSGDVVHERAGGGAWCASETAELSNCIFVGNAAAGHGGGVFGGTLLNCVLTNNLAGFGGGASSNVLINCSLLGNTAIYNNASTGGGAHGSAMTNCQVIGNRATGGIGRGGGAYASLLSDCVVSNNVAQYGGGLFYGSAASTLIASNRASVFGGGAVSNWLDACVVEANLAGTVGGGTYYGTLNDCLLITNKASTAGGAYFGTLNRCDLVRNLASGTGTANGGGGAEGSTLNFCTLVENTGYMGGGGFRATFNNCLVLTNRALGSGGGAYSGSMSNCVILGNSAINGGGYYGYRLINCTVVGNFAANEGGGVRGDSSGAVNNSIIYYNTAPVGSNHLGIKLNYCNTIPVFSSDRSITNAPMFVNLALGDLRLKTNSPCINSGKNSLAPVGPDLDGNPRIVGGTVDIGAYEVQSVGSIFGYAWAQQYGLPTDGSMDYVDSDGDGLSNWQEWHAQTDPTNNLSLLQLESPTNAPTGISVKWQSVQGVNYLVARSTNLMASPAFVTIRSNLFGQNGFTTIIDTNATGSGPFFYRVGVQD